MKLTNPDDIERRSRLIFSIYRVGAAQQKRADIAEKAGYTPEYLSRLISGERRVSDEAARNLALVLGVREEYLICKDDYITDEDYQKVLDTTNSIGKAISQVANILGYYDTDSISNILFANLDKDVEKFIIHNRLENSQKHCLINIKEKNM